ncbi:hypothetical protein JKG41_04115 [Acidithiobacillus sp. MC2.1]|uniref:hypothetical protein n=1 Tax=Acidithiobacillus TaxID=119977 RepID=UPI0015E88775|nr:MULTISPECIES: hypothetical protein [Acidithiobacillus]MBN6744264.1 hypothetical protein [Acidithiobacillus sp. MC2.2]UBU63406.1 hypothetical protein LDB30_05295 [Acidithiobacillus ferrooxidans]
MVQEGWLLPDGLIFITGLNALFTRLTGEDQEFSGGVANQFFVAVSHGMFPLIQRPDNQCGRAATDFPGHVQHFRGPEGLQQSVNDLFDGIIKSINQFADEIAEQRLREKCRTPTRSGEWG